MASRLLSSASTTHLTISPMALVGSDVRFRSKQWGGAPVQWVCRAGGSSSSNRCAAPDHPFSVGVGINGPRHFARSDRRRCTAGFRAGLCPLWVRSGRHLLT